MAFSLLADQPDQAKADSRLIVDALNAYRPRHTPGKEATAPGADQLAAALFAGRNPQTESPEDRNDAPQHERGGRRR